MFYFNSILCFIKTSLIRRNFHVGEGSEMVRPVCSGESCGTRRTGLLIKTRLKISKVNVLTDTNFCHQRTEFEV